MGELLYSAPFYQNVRKHTTNVGEILCTGKGCVACNPEKNGDKDMVKILGDIDTVNFEMESNNEENSGLKTRERPEAAPGCYGNNINERRGEKKKIKKKTKNIQAKIPPSTGKTAPKVLVTDFRQNYEKKKAKSSEKIESSKLSMKKNFMKNVPVGKEDARNDWNKYLTVPSRSNILPLKQKTTMKARASYKKASGKSSRVIKNVSFIREGKLHYTFPGSLGTTNPGGNNSQEENTSFLEMLKTSEVGIYDSKMMKVDTSSIWVGKILEQGIKEEELLPRITHVNERKSGDRSQLETTDRTTQTSFPSNAKSMLPRLSLNSKVEVRGGKSVLIIEHEHEKMKEKDKVFYRIGFELEERQVKGLRNFPKFSITEIANSLGEFVEMGVVKVIQRRNKRWLILVQGKVTKDFLLQNGVILGGRHFELMELKTF